MTERSWSTDVSAEFAKQQVSPILLAELQFDSGTLYLWNGLGDLSWNSQTWTGAGDLGEISEIRETAELRANGVNLTLSGISSSIISLALNETYHGRLAKLYLGFLDITGAIITDPIAIFVGRMDTMQLRDEGQTATVTLAAENRLIDLERPRERRYTSEDQAIDYPNDKGFAFVEALQDASIVWGRS